MERNGQKDRTNRFMSKETNFSIHTLGCKVNQYESEQISTELQKYGWEQVDFSSRADVYIINSCTVTSVANHKSRQLIRRAIKANPSAVVVVTGCYAESDRDEIATIDGVDLILGNDEKARLPQLLSERLGEYAKDILIDNIPTQPSHTRSLIKVQDGCNQFCSYCIIPYVRSNLRSRDEDEIIDEVSRLVAGGTREIVLTGIHLGHYGADTETDLGGLLAKLIKIRGLGRVRLSSIELNEVTPQMVELISASGKICNHLHIPLQSGSNNILGKMNRRYTTEEFIERADELKSKIENLGITTDIIVGFPGETDRDFKDTVEVARRVGFSKLHVFKFSPRKGTPAASFDDQVTGNIKDMRSSQLIDVGRSLSSEFASRYIGKDLIVLTERVHEQLLSGVSDNYVRVYFEGPADIVGKLVTVRIEKREEAALYGKVLVED